MGESAKWDMTEVAVRSYLHRLNPDPERAGEMLVRLRRELERSFESRNVAEADRWADITVDRAIRRNSQDPSKVKDPTTYLWGVAANTFREALRRERRQVRLDSIPEVCCEPVEIESPGYEGEALLEWLHRSEELSAEDRRLIIGWYSCSGPRKADYKRQLADQEGVSVSALRVRAFRARRRVRRLAMRAGFNPTKIVSDLE